MNLFASKSFWKSAVIEFENIFVYTPHDGLSSKYGRNEETMDQSYGKLDVMDGLRMQQNGVQCIQKSKLECTNLFDVTTEVIYACLSFNGLILHVM